MTATTTDITEDLIRALLCEQHPDLADRPLRLGARGWDNQMWRLGEDLAVRLPWATQSADALLRKEHTWLPLLAPTFPCRSPSPNGWANPPHPFPAPGSSPPGYRAHPQTAPPPHTSPKRPTLWRPS